MNLLENYIKEVLHTENVTNEYTMKMRKHDPEFESSEPILKVTCFENCYGSESIKTHYWRESEFNKVIEQGYYMG